MHYTDVVEQKTAKTRQKYRKTTKGKSKWGFNAFAKIGQKQDESMHIDKRMHGNDDNTYTK